MHEENEAQAPTLSTGKLANYLGISPQGLHWHEQHGLVQPRKTGSGYREYTLDDLCILSRTRFYRQCGFSTESIKELMTSEPRDARAVIGQRIDDMKRAIALEQARLEALEKNEELLSRAEEEKPFVERSVLEPFWLKKIFDSDHGKLTPASESARIWTEHIPFAHYCSVRMRENGAMKDLVGIGISEKSLAYGDDALIEEIETGKALFIPRQPAVYAVVAPRRSPFICALVETVLETGIAAEDELDGSVFARPITCHKTHDGVQTYWEAWLPLASQHRGESGA